MHWSSQYSVIRFLQEYSKHNISLWGVTTENEPTAGFVPNYGFQCMGFTAEMQRDFVKMDLGPAMHKNGFQNVKIMIMDDQRNSLPHWPSVVSFERTLISCACKALARCSVDWYILLNKKTLYDSSQSQEGVWYQKLSDAIKTGRTDWLTISFLVFSYKIR